LKILQKEVSVGVEIEVGVVEKVVIGKNESEVEDLEIGVGVEDERNHQVQAEDREADLTNVEEADGIKKKTMHALLCLEN